MTPSDEPLKVVFDCNVMLQAAANPDGPAAACVEQLRAGRLLLILHQGILAEFREVSSRPMVARKLSLNDAIVEAFIEDVLAYSRVLDSVPSVFLHPIDPKDSIYVDVAIAAGAAVITTRDFHPINLRNPNRAEPLPTGRNAGANAGSGRSYHVGDRL